MSKEQYVMPELGENMETTLTQYMLELNGKVGGLSDKMQTTADSVNDLKEKVECIDKTVTDMRIDLAQNKTNSKWVKWLVVTIITLVLGGSGFMGGSKIAKALASAPVQTITQSK